MMSDFEKLKHLGREQREVLKLLTTSHNTKGAAEILKVSPKTIEYHRSRLFGQLNVLDMAGLTRFAIRTNLIKA